jgi:hypothetical protein
VRLGLGVGVGVLHSVSPLVRVSASCS